jgi:hypothetical protein
MEYNGLWVHEWLGSIDSDTPAAVSIELKMMHKMDLSLDVYHQ